MAFKLSAGVIATVVAAATPAQAIPIDPGGGGGTCASTSSGSVSASASAITLGQSMTVAWSFGSTSVGCSALISLMYRDRATGVATDTGQGGRSGSATLSPTTNGNYFLRVTIINWTGAYGYAAVTVSPPVGDRPTFDITRNDQKALFAQVVGLPNATVRIAGNVDLDLSYMDNIYIAQGVQIIGLRTAAYPHGPRIYTTTYPRRLLNIGYGNSTTADDVRVTGIRLDGGLNGRVAESEEEDSDGITIASSLGVEIDNSELYGWRGASVFIGDEQGRINWNSARMPYIHNNYIHHNQHQTGDVFGGGHGAGYGVETAYGAYGRVERNAFDFNRHAIASDGRAGSGYIFSHNYIANTGGTTTPLIHTHQVDMHGRDNCGLFGSYNCGLAGEYIDISYNSILYTGGNAIKLRGTPKKNAADLTAAGMFVHHNVFSHTDLWASVTDSAVAQTESGLTARDNQLGYRANWSKKCDFDGDGTDEILEATGVDWWIFENSANRFPVHLRSSSITNANITALSDVNGDGRCDVTTTNGTFLTPYDDPVVVTSTAVVRNADGRMTMFAVDSGRQVVFTRTQVAPGSDTWSAWSTFATALSTIAAGINGNGLIEFFGADRTGKMWHRWQSAPNSASWSQWEVFGTSVSAISVTSAANGFTVFTLDLNGKPWGRVQYIGPNGSNGGGSWSSWGQFDGTCSTIAAETNANGLMELFCTDANGGVWHRWELTHYTGSWSPWTYFGTLSSQPSTIAAATWGPGGAVVVYGTDGSARIWGRIGYTSPNGSNGGGSWSAWEPMDGTLSGITAIRTPDKRIELFGVDGWGKLFRRKEQTAGTFNWSPWQSLDPPNGGLS